jgi:hypothetical protein
LNGSLDVQGAVNLQNSLTLAGNADFNGQLNVQENSVFQKAVQIDGASDLNGALDVQGAVNLQNSLTLAGNADFNGQLNVQENSVFQKAVQIDGAAALNSTLAVSGAATLSSTLNVAQAATFQNNVTVNGNLTVLGTQTLVNTEVMSVKDAAILIANDNQADTIQAGIQIQYKPDPEGAAKYAGLKRMPNTGEFVFFEDASSQIEDQSGSPVYASVIADSFNSASDARLKNQIVNLDGALDKIDHIRGVYHHWIHENQPQERQIGVIAQEVQAIYPELVNEGGNGFLSVNYPKLTAVLLQSIKELKAMVLDLAKKQ